MRNAKKKGGFQYLILLLSALLGLSVVSACGGAAENAKPAAAAPKNEGSKNTASQTSPSANTTASTKLEGDADWNKIVEAAKKEGTLFLSAPSGKVWRDAILKPWEKAYPDIKIEYSSHSGRSFYTKMLQEQKIGQYNWDLRIGGTSEAYDNKQAFTAIKPILKPEYLDEKLWFGGLDGLWGDVDKQYFPTFLARGNTLVHVNRDKAPDFKSLEQIVDPKYKGKIVLQDPAGGSGLGSLATMLHAYGEDFIRKLLKEQNIVVMDDARLMAEQLVRGKYSIAIGANDYHIKLFQDQGLGKSVDGLFTGPQALSVGSGSIQFLKNAPHPNASRVFINWLLSKEAQTEITHLTEDYNSRRTDVEPANKLAVIDNSKINDYFEHQAEENGKYRDQIEKLVKELIK